MVIAYAENYLVVGQDSVVEFINIILFHIDKRQIQFFMKCHKQLREKYSTQHGRDSNAKRGFYPGHAGVVSLKFITILKNISSFFVEGFSLLGQTQLISFSGKKTDSEFDFQVANGHGNGWLGHI